MGKKSDFERERWKRKEIQDPLENVIGHFMMGRDGARTPMQWDSEGGFSTNTSSTMASHTEILRHLFNNKNKIRIAFGIPIKSIFTFEKISIFANRNMNSLDVLYHKCIDFLSMEGEHFWIFINLSNSQSKQSIYL